jgi:hypothetical protein
MNEGQSQKVPGPTGAFDHPGAGTLSQHSIDEKPGYSCVKIGSTAAYATVGRG